MKIIKRGTIETGADGNRYLYGWEFDYEGRAMTISDTADLIIEYETELECLRAKLAETNDQRLYEAAAREKWMHYAMKLEAALRVIADSTSRYHAADTARAALTPDQSTNTKETEHAP